MTRVRTVALLGVLAVGASGLAFAQDAAKIDQGKAVYAERRCRMCHSIGGEGNSKGSLDGIGSKLSAEEIKQWLHSPKEMAEKAKATRKPPMRAFTDLTAAEADALVTYLSSLKAK